MNIKSEEFLGKNLIFETKIGDFRGYLGDPEILRKDVLNNCEFDIEKSKAFLPLESSSSVTGSSNFKDLIKKSQEAFVWRLKQPDSIIVCFRGTNPVFGREFLIDVVTDASFKLDKWDRAPPSADGEVKVHDGFADGYDTTATFVLDHVEYLYSVSRRKLPALPDVHVGFPIFPCAQLGSYPEWITFSHGLSSALLNSVKVLAENQEATNSNGKAPEVIVTGHSLGGALATLCAVELSHRQINLSTGQGHSPEVKCMTFGAPRIGSQSFTELVNSGSPNLCLLRAVNRHDIVPRVPPISNRILWQWLLGYDDKIGYTIWLKDPGPTPVEILPGADFPEDFGKMFGNIIFKQVPQEQIGGLEKWKPIV